MSIVTSVEQEFSTLLSEDISAASSAAIINPERPGGSSRCTRSGNAVSPVASAGHSARAMRPGSTRMNTGVIFSADAKTVPAWACGKLRALSVFCTMT